MDSRCLNDTPNILVILIIICLAITLHYLKNLNTKTTLPFIMLVIVDVVLIFYFIYTRFVVCVHKKPLAIPSGCKPCLPFTGCRYKC